ncbi:MAG: BrnT family toxin [Nitrospirota bacterium]
MIDFQKIEGFQWDKGNIHKNEKHGIHFQEAEQIFTNEPLLLLPDEKHSQRENRYHAIGRTNEGRILHVSFTLREQNTRIRIISARDANKKERSIYEQQKA